jgi:hypothetical protein
MMSWLDQLTWNAVPEVGLCDAGIDPRAVVGVNTEAELAEALAAQ